MSKAVTKTSVSVSFVLKEAKIHLDKTKERNETTIVFRVSAGRGVQKRFSTGYKINPLYWDSSKQKVRNVAAISNSVEINNYLDELKNNFNKAVANSVAKGELITRSFLDDLYEVISNRKQVVDVEEEMTFFKFCDDFIELKKKTLIAKKGNKNDTIKAYEQAIGFIKSFQKEEGFKVDFDTIDLNFYYEFVDYMQTKKKADGGLYSANTIGKHIKTLKTILNSATSEGFNTNLKYKHTEFKIVKELTTAIYLTSEEIKEIFRKDLTNYPRHQKARDLFFMGCATGQRVSDFNRFSECLVENHKGSEYVVLNQFKTGNKVYCRITPAMRLIMNTRYDGKFPSPMVEQHINDLIKEVAHMVGIKELVNYERTQGGKKIIEKIPKYNLVSTHTARRSYATNKFKAGVLVHDIMILTGHKSEREFLKYIREDGQEQAHRVATSEEFENSFLKVV